MDIVEIAKQKAAIKEAQRLAEKQKADEKEKDRQKLYDDILAALLQFNDVKCKHGLIKVVNKDGLYIRVNATVNKYIRVEVGNSERTNSNDNVIKYYINIDGGALPNSESRTLEHFIDQFTTAISEWF